MSVHGTARFATLWEMAAHGLVNETIPPEWESRGAFIGWWRESSKDFRRIDYGGDLHQLIVGGTGGGKFTTALAPMLLGSFLDDQTVVVVDPKGEIAKLVGAVWQPAYADKKKVILLDPWDDCETRDSASLNVMDEINEDNPRCVDDARALADALVIPSGSENTHWDNAARNFLTAIILFVGIDPSEKERRTLTRVRDLITSPWEMPKAYKGPPRTTLSSLIYKHLENKHAGGAIKRGFSSILNREDKERSGIISSIERDTAWIDSPQMQRVLQTSSFSLADVADGYYKYFIVIPFEYMETHRGWLRLMVVAFAKALRRYPSIHPHTDHRRWRHIVIDEFATLGEMSFVRNDVAIARGYNVKYHLVVQDFAQLKGIYGERWHSFVNNTFQRVFAVGDLFTADQISKIAGSATVESLSRSSSETVSQNEGVSQSANKGEGLTGPPQPSRSFNHGESLSLSQGNSTGWSSSVSVNPVHRPLITADEVRRLHENEQVLLFRGMQPIRCLRLPYFVAFRKWRDSTPWTLNYSLRAILWTVGMAPEPGTPSNQPLPIRLIHPSFFRFYPELDPPEPPPPPDKFVLTWRHVAGFAAFGAATFAALFIALDIVTYFFPNPAAVASWPTLIEKPSLASAQSDAATNDLVPASPKPSPVPAEAPLPTDKSELKTVETIETADTNVLPIPRSVLTTAKAVGPNQAARPAEVFKRLRDANDISSVLGVLGPSAARTKPEPTGPIGPSQQPVLATAPTTAQPKVQSPPEIPASLGFSVRVYENYRPAADPQPARPFPSIVPYLPSGKKPMRPL